MGYIVFKKLKVRPEDIARIMLPECLPSVI